jgi:hypothetical protein
MNYSELMQLYFERSVALQWYWTIYIIVIGGILGFSTFRERPDTAIAVLVTVLYACFAYKNLGALEATLTQQQAIRTAIKEYPVSQLGGDYTRRERELLEPELSLSESAGVRYFHVACDLLTVGAIWAKEWRRRQTAERLSVPAT